MKTGVLRVDGIDETRQGWAGDLTVASVDGVVGLCVDALVLGRKF